METSPVPPKPSPDIWPAKLITSKSGGIATADGENNVVLGRSLGTTYEFVFEQFYLHHFSPAHQSMSTEM